VNTANKPIVAVAAAPVKVVFDHSQVSIEYVENGEGIGTFAKVSRDGIRFDIPGLRFEERQWQRKASATLCPLKIGMVTNW
jgi:hypothetical protein